MIGFESLHLAAKGGRVVWLVIAEGHVEVVVNDGERCPVGDLCIGIPTTQTTAEPIEEAAKVARGKV